MLNIRLSRVGKRNYAQYRLVVAEKSSPVKGKFVEQLGSYDPHDKVFAFKEDRVKYWLSQGASCSDTVHNLLVEHGVVDADKRVVPLKTKPVEDNGEQGEKKTEEVKGGSSDIKDGGENVDKDNGKEIKKQSDQTSSEKTSSEKTEVERDGHDNKKVLEEKVGENAKK